MRSSAQLIASDTWKKMGNQQRDVELGELLNIIINRAVPNIRSKSWVFRRSMSLASPITTLLPPHGGVSNGRRGNVLDDGFLGTSILLH